MSIDRRTSLMILAALPGLGPVNIRRLDQAMAGCAEQLLFMPESERRNWCSGSVVKELGEWEQYFNPAKVRDELEALEADFVTFEEERYPERLRHFGDRPVGLYRCRAGRDLEKRGIAIVGTRKPTAYGRKVARELSAELSQRGFSIISGLAEGIDTEAHRAALDAGGSTVAVLGGGLNRCYPVSNRGLMEQVKESGGVWTEFPLWRRADRRSFPQRNRIVAGMSEAVVVIESGNTGGSLITARMGTEQGKPVYVIPGRIDSPESVGCHALIRDGAQLVTCVEDILEDLNYLPGMLRAASENRAEPARRSRLVEPSLDGLASRVWEFLGDRSHAHLDTISGGLDIPPSEASGVLLEMELSGLLCRRLDGCYERS